MVHALKCQVHANRSLQVSIIRWHMQHSKRRICSMSHIFGEMRSKHRTFWRTTANSIILALLSSLYSQHTFWVYLGVDGNIQRQFSFTMLNVKENCLLLKLLSQTQKNVSELQTGVELICVTKTFVFIHFVSLYTNLLWDKKARTAHALWISFATN